MKHVKVFQDRDTFAGWPANHGSWQWGNEFLVGFMTGPYAKDDQGHKIGRPFRKLQARSLDGGETWQVEDPGVTFDCVDAKSAPPFDLTKSIIRVCGNYDTGGENCRNGGGFYLSEDKGKSWFGAYTFGALEVERFSGDMWNTSRTCVVDNRVFLSACRRDSWGSDYIFEAEHDGRAFHFTSEVARDEYRAVMPAVSMIGETTYIVCRRKGGGFNWIDSYVKHGSIWGKQSPSVMDTGWYNGNPPALAVIDGKLYCAFGNRSDKAIYTMKSDNGGLDWIRNNTLRVSAVQDIGYPRLFTRTDGKLVCVYYFTDTGEPQRIEACVFDP